jgi:hypothetical protein
MRPRLLTLILGFVVLPGCVSHSSFINTWNKPGAKPIDPATSKVAVVFISPDATSRVAGEDLMVRKLGEHGIRAIPAESIFVADEVSTAPAMQRRFKDAGINIVLTMRVLEEGAALDTGQQPYDQFPPRLDYLQLSQYWGYGWGRVYVPGYLRNNSLVGVETFVYSLPRDYMMWGSRSRPVLKREIPSLIAELGDSVPKDMVRVGLLAPNPQKAVAMR